MRRRVIEVGSVVVAFVALGVLLYNATLVDRTPPSVTRISLSASVAGDDHTAQTLTAIDVTFSEPVRQASVESRIAIDPYVAGTFSWDGQTTAIFTPAHKLPPDTAFTVTVRPGFEDLAGNASAQAVSPFSFRTVGPPIVSATSPADGAADVPVDGTVVLTFDRLMDTGSVENAIQITPPAAHHAAWSGRVVTIAFDGSLQFGTRYQIVVTTDAADTGGNHLAQPFSMAFQTVAAGLSVVTVTPAASVAGVSVRSPIAIVFDQAVDPATISGALQVTPPVTGSLSVEDLPDDLPVATPGPGAGSSGGAGVSPGSSPEDASSGSSPGSSPPGGPGSPTAPGAGRVLILRPSAQLAAHTTYTVTLKSGVAMLGNSSQVAAGRSWSFTTGQPTTSAQNQIAFLSARGGVRNVWLMNPDGTSPRQVTTELVPVTSFDVASDGRSIVYAAGGIVRVASTDGSDVRTLTAAGRHEYAARLTPDGTAVVLARRDPTGADLGYWLVPLDGRPERQLLPAGAPPLGSVELAGDGLVTGPGTSAWAGRDAFSPDGRWLLVTTGAGGVELVDLTATQAGQPVRLGLQADTPAAWDAGRHGFVLTAADGNLWLIVPEGTNRVLAPGVGGVAVASTAALATLVGPGGPEHLAVLGPGAASPSPLTTATDLADRQPSFSPDGGTILFLRVQADQPTLSAGIWTVAPDGRELRQLSTDGASPRWLP